LEPLVIFYTKFSGISIVAAVFLFMGAKAMAL